MFTPLHDTLYDQPQKSFCFYSRFHHQAIQQPARSSIISIERSSCRGLCQPFEHLLSHLIFNTTTGIFWESLNHLHFPIPKSVFETANLLFLWPVSTEASLARAYHSSTSFSSWFTKIIYLAPSYNVLQPPHFFHHISSLPLYCLVTLCLVIPMICVSII